MSDPTYHPGDSDLNEYLDGALDASGQAALEAHLAGCQDCARRLAELEALFMALERLPDEVPDRDLAKAVHQALRKPSLGANQGLILTLGAAAQLFMAGAALVWLVPAAAWGNLAAGLGGPFHAPDLPGLLSWLAPRGSGSANFSVLEGLASSWLAWMGVVSQAWQTLRAGLALDAQNLAGTGLNHVSFVELSWIGLAGLLVWLAGNGILIGSLNRKSRRRNS